MHDIILPINMVYVNDFWAELAKPSARVCYINYLCRFFWDKVAYFTYEVIRCSDIWMVCIRWLRSNINPPFPPLFLLKCSILIRRIYCDYGVIEHVLSALFCPSGPLYFAIILDKHGYVQNRSIFKEAKHASHEHQQQWWEIIRLQWN